MISLLILFWLDDSTPEGNSAPSIVLTSSSSVELDDSDSDSDSDRLVFFFLVGLQCTCGFLGATFFGEGDLSFNETWPCMYGRRVVIRLLVKAISSLKDSGPHDSFTNKFFKTHIFRIPARRTRFSDSGSSQSNRKIQS